MGTKQIRIRVERADKMTGETDSLISQVRLMSLEKGLKQAGRKERGRGSSRRSDKKEDKRKIRAPTQKAPQAFTKIKGKGKKPFTRK